MTLSVGPPSATKRAFYISSRSLQTASLSTWRQGTPPIDMFNNELSYGSQVSRRLHVAWHELLASAHDIQPVVAQQFPTSCGSLACGVAPVQQWCVSSLDPENVPKSRLVVPKLPFLPSCWMKPPCGAAAQRHSY